MQSTSNSKSIRLLFVIAALLFIQLLTITFADAQITSSNHQKPNQPNPPIDRRPVEERFSLPTLPTLVDSNVFEKLFKKLEQAIENVVNNVTTNIRYQVSQAIIDVLNKNQITQVTDSAMSAISQNISTLLNNIPFNQLLQNSLAYSQPIITQFAKQFTNQQVIETVKASFKENDIDFSTIVSEIINATITKLSEPQTKQEINGILGFYAVHMTDVIPTWFLVFMASVLISIIMIPSLLIAILIQQVFPFRKMKWYQRVSKYIYIRFGVSNREKINDETRHLVFEENVQQ